MIIVLGLLLLVLPFGHLELTSYTIPKQISGESPIVSAIEGALDVTVVCEIFNGINPFITSWRLTSGGSQTSLRFYANGTGRDAASQNFFVTGEPSGQGTTQANFTILTFTTSLDQNVLGCFTGPIALGNFTLRLIGEVPSVYVGLMHYSKQKGIAKLPVLLQSSQQVATEADLFSLSIQETEGFPVDIISFQWYFNGSPIAQDGSNPNTTVYPNITFNRVNRTNNGNYSITVSHEGGFSNGSFQLDVQYGPEGVSQSTGPFHNLLGDNVTLVAFTGIGGNPTPSSSWSTEAGPVTSGGRFTTSVPGQLTITSLSLNDSVNYTNELTNMVGGNLLTISNTLELQVADHPSMPRALTVLSIGAEYVNMSWLNPLNAGTPLFTKFRIEAVSVINVVNRTFDVTNREAGFLNNLLVEGLKPNTEYNLTIRALSTVKELGVLISEPSETVYFNTIVGAPSISVALLDNINGSLLVSWEFLHTGGIDLETVTVQCSEEDEDSTNLLAVKRECSTNVECVTGSVFVGPVNAGVNYSCLVIAANHAGRDEMNTDNILTTSGIPSVPVIISVLGGAGIATITLRVGSFGVLVATDFTFIVSVFSPSDTSSPVAVRMITPDSVASPIVAIVVDGLSEGTYLFSVISRNIFSPLSSSPPLTSQVNVQYKPGTNTRSVIMAATSSLSRPYATQTMSTASGSSVGIIIGGIAIAFLLLLVVIGQFVVVVIFVVYKAKVIKEVKKPSPNRDLTAMQLPGTRYEIVYDQPDQIIDVEQNVAYGEVKSAK